MNWFFKAILAAETIGWWWWWFKFLKRDAIISRMKLVHQVLMEQTAASWMFFDGQGM
jgi:hypothetical protein